MKGRCLVEKDFCPLGSIKLSTLWEWQEVVENFNVGDIKFESVTDMLFCLYVDL